MSQGVGCLQALVLDHRAAFVAVAHGANIRHPQRVAALVPAEILSEGSTKRVRTGKPKTQRPESIDPKISARPHWELHPMLSSPSRATSMPPLPPARARGPCRPVW